MHRMLRVWHMYLPGLQSLILMQAILWADPVGDSSLQAALDVPDEDAACGESTCRTSRVGQENDSAQPRAKSCLLVEANPLLSE